MKRAIASSLLAVAAAVLLHGGLAAAQNGIAVAAGYWKGSQSFDLVVKETPGASLKLYVNDKHPVGANSNKQGWATFKKVSLSRTGKLSFTQVFVANGKRFEKPINYTRQFTVNGHSVSFSAFSKPAPAPTITTQPAQPVATTPTPESANTGLNDTNLSNNNTYVNSDGNTVHSPADSTDGSVPAGATAQCRDGSYSFSQHRSGTCSGHGGVAQWL